MVSGVLEDLVYEKDTKSFPISKLVKVLKSWVIIIITNITLIIIIKLFKVWESGVIKGKILDHLKALCKHRRTLEEAARFKLFVKLEMNM